MWAFLSEFFGPMPDGPSVFFGRGVQLFDAIRLMIFVMCAAVVATTYKAAVDPSSTLSYKARLVGVATVFVFYVAGTEFVHLGDYANWRLYVGFFACLCTSWGSWAYFKYENPPTIKVAHGGNGV